VGFFRTHYKLRIIVWKDAFSANLAYGMLGIVYRDTIMWQVPIMAVINTYCRKLVMQLPVTCCSIDNNLNEVEQTLQMVSEQKGFNFGIAVVNTVNVADCLQVFFIRINIYPYLSRSHRFKI